MHAKYKFLLLVFKKETILMKHKKVIDLQQMFQLDSATSLIQAAKNLMNAVVLTVKSSYVASTKYPRPAGQVVVSSKSRFSVAMLNRVK